MRIMRIIGNKIKTALSEITCKHWWETNLIFSGGEKTHHDIKSCIKCGKTKTTFSGTRDEWREFHGFKERE